MLAFLLAGLASCAAAHEYPIRPVRVVLKVEPDRVVADIKSDSIYWIEEVIGDENLPTTRWPEEERRKAEAYANAHLRLLSDGRALPGKLVWQEYVRRPWEVYEQGVIRMRLVYPPAEDARSLSVAADFFEDYRQERLKAGEPLAGKDFRTDLRLPGVLRGAWPLLQGKPFEISIAEARRTVLRRFAESLRRGAGPVLSLVEGWAALAALALSFSTASSWAFAGLAALLWPAASPGPWAWGAGLAAALAAGRWLGESSSPWLEGAALFALSRAWSGAALPWLPRAAPGWLERGGAALGGALGAALVLIALLLLVELERRRASSDSAARAGELFARRRRLAATALALLSAIGVGGAS